MIKVYKILILFIITGFSTITFSGERFKSSHPCQEASKVCDEAGELRFIDGFSVYRDCWKWSYSKTCSYPSKNNCRDYAHCYAVAQLPCLLTDSLGNCVNLQREFSCKSWNPVTLENKTVRMDLVAKDGQEGLVCKGIPCLDGNCVDKSYMTNGEMMDSVSKLYAASQMQPDKQGNFSLFQGTGEHCSKKATSYSNCCAIAEKGWGTNIGAHCTRDEKHLMEQRAKKLCVYVGKQNKGSLNVVVKHHYCCFPTLLDKVIQVEGRKQLGMNFGSGGNANCRGFTVDEIQRLDFSRMDLTEFIEDFKAKFAGRYKAPNPGEIQSKVASSQDNIRKYDGNPNNQGNNMSGWHTDMKDNSYEAEEEARLERERLERKRMAKEEAGRLEKERLAAELNRQRLEKERLQKENLAVIEQQRKQQEAVQQQKAIRRAAKEKEIAIARNEAEAAYQRWRSNYAAQGGEGADLKYMHLPWYPEHARLCTVQQQAKAKLERLEKELMEGRY